MESDIKTALDDMSNNVTEFMKDLSNAKKELDGLEDSINSRIKIIRGQYKAIEDTFNNLGSLIFVTLTADLGGTVNRSLNTILEQVDKIFYEDLENITNVYEKAINGTLSFLA